MATTIASKDAAQPTAKKAPAKIAKNGGTITVVQTGSPIGRRKDQRATLVGLKLNKMHRKSTLQDSPEVRGMIDKVKHLLSIVE